VSSLFRISSRVINSFLGTFPRVLDDTLLNRDGFQVGEKLAIRLREPNASTMRADFGFLVSNFGTHRQASVIASSHDQLKLWPASVGAASNWSHRVGLT